MDYEKAKEKALVSFNNDDLAASVFFKYALKNDDDKYSEWSLNQLRKRLKEGMLDCEETKFKNKKEDWEKPYTDLFKHFIFAGRILYALNNPYDTNSTFSNCYVTEIAEDNLTEIFNTARKQAIIFSRGGGVGFDISTLRPRGAKVNNSAKTTTGAVSFMDLYSLVTGIIGQYGRRGALMLSISINHPDVIEFIKVKGGVDKDKIKNANISVRISDDFMKAVEADIDWEMTFTLKNGELFVRKDKARNIWNTLIDCNRRGAEPGILFWDNIINEDPAAVYDETRPISTNPCAEEPLEKGGACVLGSMDLNTFVKNSFKENATFDYDKFCEMVTLGVRALDNIVELNLDRQPLPENREAAELGRRIGLGFTGLADTLIRMNMVYDSDEAIQWVENLIRIFKDASVKASIDLAIERGAFKLFTQSKVSNKFIAHKYFNDLDDEYKSKLKEYGMRNVGINTVAPNGSISIILQTSSGLEPIFRNEYERTVIQGAENGEVKRFITYHPLVLEYNALYGEDAHKTSSLFITSDKIDWVQRVKMQSVIQKNISQSISSTINLPQGTTNETIDTIYREAWKHGLKGCTIYVDKCRDGILNDVSSTANVYILPHVKFPKSGEAKFKVIKSEKRKWYCFYTIDEDTRLPNSLFVNTNSAEQGVLTEEVIDKFEDLLVKHNIEQIWIDELKKKYTHQPNVVKIARTLSMLLRHRVSIGEIIEAINAVQAPVFSFVFQIKKLLGEFVEGDLTGEACPSCESGQLIFEGGCVLCRDCGFTKCA